MKTNIDTNLVINPSEIEFKNIDRKVSQNSFIFNPFVFKTPKSRNGANHEFELSANNSLYEYIIYHDIRNIKNHDLTLPLNKIPAFLKMKSPLTPIKRRSKKFWISTQQFYIRTLIHPSRINENTSEPMTHIFSSHRVEYSNYTVDMNSYERIHNLENKDNIQKITRIMPHYRTPHSFYITEQDRITTKNTHDIKYNGSNFMEYLNQPTEVVRTYTDLLTRCRNKNFDSILDSYEEEINNYFENITQKHNPQLVAKKSFLDKLKDIFN